MQMQATMREMCHKCLHWQRRGSPWMVSPDLWLPKALARLSTSIILAASPGPHILCMQLSYPSQVPLLNKGATHKMAYAHPA